MFIIKNQIIITIAEDGKITSRMQHPMDIRDIIAVLATATLGFMRTLVGQVPPEAKQGVTESLYDMYNAAASHVLEEFAPEIEMRPNLTADAILRAEDKILNENAEKDKTLRVLK